MLRKLFNLLSKKIVIISGLILLQLFIFLGLILVLSEYFVPIYFILVILSIAMSIYIINKKFQNYMDFIHLSSTGIRWADLFVVWRSKGTESIA